MRTFEMDSARPSSPALRRDFERVPPAIVEQAARFPASVLADVAGRRGALDGRIAPLAPSMRIAGPAFTIDVRPGDNLMIHAAIATAQPGDVLVVDGKGDTTCALMGAIMITACKALGIGGVVMDGSHRDTEELLAMGYPVYSIGASPNGPTKAIPGRLNGPISCGGVPIHPGDLVVGDADGVVVLPRELAASLLPLAERKLEEERVRIADIVSGRNVRPAWLDGALRSAGLLAEGESL